MNSIREERFTLRKILTLTSLSGGVLSFLLPIYSKTMDMSAIQITGLFSWISFILIILRPIIGSLIDKVGTKFILITSIISFSISFILFSISNTTLSLYIARTFQGLAIAFMTICTHTVISNTTELNTISEQFGKINSAKSTGNIYGCILAFIILSITPFIKGWKILFLIFSLSSLYALVILIKDFKITNYTFLTNSYEKQKLSKENMYLLLIIFLSSTLASMLSPIFMIYIQQKFSNRIVILGLAFFPALLVESLCAHKLGRLSDHIKKKKAMIIGVIICSVVTILTPTVNSIVILSVLWFISSIGTSLYTLSEKGIYTQMNEKYYKGQIYGKYTLVCDLGMVVGPLIGGILYEHISQETPFYINGIAWVGLAILIISCVR